MLNPYQEGIDAVKYNRIPPTNPYPPSSKEGIEWKQGVNDATY